MTSIVVMRLHLVMSLPAGGGGGGVTASKGANSISVSVLSFWKALVGTGWAVSLLLWMIALRKKFFLLVWPPFLALKVNTAWKVGLGRSCSIFSFLLFSYYSPIFSSSTHFSSSSTYFSQLYSKNLTSYIPNTQTYIVLVLVDAYWTLSCQIMWLYATTIVWTW